ncbi:hypothetical protein M9H77_33803 [Catharanthus roseus]|uniref:Uncharacterized protein n=1 Tax=Catharanthus roseus TaxID=4058 RepID=A0ACB9ZL69_CATRO|nr:hypothetical protein M9H77_33803 [Catharanthus roseus]
MKHFDFHSDKVFHYLHFFKIPLMNSDEHEYEYLKKTEAVPSDDKLKDEVNGTLKIDPSKNSDPSQRPRQKSHRHDENFDHQVKRSTVRDESDQDENDWNSSLSSHLSLIGRERNEREKSRRTRESKNRDRDREDKSRKKKVGDKIRERNGDRCSDGGKRNRDSVYVRDTEKEREQERSNRDRNRSERYRAECDRERSEDKRRIMIWNIKK